MTKTNKKENKTKFEKQNKPKQAKNIVDENLTWDTSHIFKTETDWQNAFDKVKLNVEKIENFKGKLKNKKKLLEYYKLMDDISMNLNLLYAYAQLNRDTDSKNTKYISMQEALGVLYSKLTEKNAFASPEQSKISDRFYKKLLTDKNFEEYDNYIDAVLLSKKHTLSEDAEVALSTNAKFAGGFEEVFSTMLTSDFKFEPVKIGKQTEVLHEGTYGKFITNKDETVRDEAYTNLYKTYGQFNQTLAMNYIYFLKEATSKLKLRKYKNTFEAEFLTEKLPKEVYLKLLENVDKNINLEQEYFKLLKSNLNVKKFGFKDVYLSLAGGMTKTWTIDQQKQIVLDAMSPLGEKYQAVLKEAYDSRWIDFLPKENKRSGGYMLGVFGAHPYVLLNNNQTYSSLSTLAHELGHAMHTYLSNKNQPFSKHSYATFIAEIASTVNEVLLNKYMQKNAKTDEEKLFYLSEYLQNFKSTIFRQTMFEEFEDFAITKIENDEILNPEILNKKYTELLKKHFGNVVPVDDKIVFEWSRIPHFYTPYYVFQYATSYVSSIYIANCILENKNNMIEKYFEMLKSGSCDYPLELLKKTGVDLLSDEPYNYVFEDMKNCLTEAKKLIKKSKTK